MNNQNWSPKTIWTGDNLDIMRGMNSESVDLIYLDPPFNSNANYAAPIGSKAAGAEFKDTWSLSDIDVAWLDLIEAKHPQLNYVIKAASTKSDKSYLIYMAPRLLEMKRLLKSTGSIYLHCDPTMSHYLKLLMDCIFGRKNFRNEIVWSYTKVDASKNRFGRNSDTILFYSISNAGVFNPIMLKRDKPVKQLLRENVNGVLKNRKGEDGKVLYRMSYEKKAGNVWEIPVVMPASKERVGYPTQKPLALLERIIKASSNKGDVVFDPFCGCATTLVAADGLERNWVGIDVSPLAVKLLARRIKKAQGLFQDIARRDDVPSRTDLGDLPKYNSPENKTKLYGEQGGDCNGCGEHFEPRNFHVDHIIDRKHGGTDHIHNLQLLCGACNSLKGDRGMEYLESRLKEER